MRMDVLVGSLPHIVGVRLSCVAGITVVVAFDEALADTVDDIQVG